MAGSYWGTIQHTRVLARGLKIVSTAGHGGVMVTMLYADKHLSEAAKKRGTRYGNYLCYEEDCDFSIPIFESPDVWAQLWPDKDGRAMLISSLSLWNADYLLEIGEAPGVEAEAFFMRKKIEQMRREKDGDLIISAFPAEIKDVSDIIVVTTADNKLHFIMADGYAGLKIKLLSLCKIYHEDAPVALNLKHIDSMR